MSLLLTAFDAHQQTTATVHNLAIDNPLNGIIPDFGVFGADFNNIWKKLAAGLWGLGILIAVGFLGHGILGIAQNRGGHPGQLRESKKEATNAGIALGGLIALATVVGAFLAIFG